MKTNTLIHLAVAVALAPGFRAGAANIYLPNLLADPGFESGTPVTNAVGGWYPVAGAGFSHNYRHSGAWSMSCFYEPTFQMGICFQTLPATAGLTYTLTAWGLTPQPLSLAPSASILFLVFGDVNGSSLGTETRSFLMWSTPANTWISSSVTATAPPGTALLTVGTGLYGAIPGGVVYCDDLSLVAIPEPSSLALLTLAAAARFGIRRRH